MEGLNPVDTLHPLDGDRGGDQALVIRHAAVVLEDEVLEDAAVVVRGGAVAEVAPSEGVSLLGAHVVDARGAYLLPGVIDTHNDGIEREINPRPRVGFPKPFALANYARRAVAAGVTTSFHAVTFGNMVRNNRSVDETVAITEAIREWPTLGGIDHQLLHRCDVWSPRGLDPLFESLRRCRFQAMSLNDHTPGQGQYRNVDVLRTLRSEYRQAGYNIGGEEDELRRRMEERAADTTTVPGVWRRAKEELARQPYVLASHDDDTPEKVDQMVEVGCTISEFPVTLEAARRARERGLWITVGAPNVVRGGSTTGNASAVDLAAEGLADVICADYHAPSLLYAAFKLADMGLRTLPQAVAMVTANAARAFHLADRGRIAPGGQADLALVTRTPAGPETTLVLRRGAIVYSTGPLALATPSPSANGRALTPTPVTA